MVDVRVKDCSDYVEMINVPVVSRGAYVSPYSICSYLLITSVAL